MLGHLHRDLLNRVIKQYDVVVWANRKYGTGLTICRVMDSTPETIRLHKLTDDKLTNVNPNNVIVITQQINDNLENNVGSNLDR